MLMAPQMEAPPAVAAPALSKLDDARPEEIVSRMAGVLVASLSSPSPAGSCGSSTAVMPVTEDAALGGTGDK